MDKSTLSTYGWIVIVTLVLSVMMAITTPFGTFAGKTFSNVAKFFVQYEKDEMENINTAEVEWEKYIKGSTTVFHIGRTKSEYVVAEFNYDFTEVTIYKNGENSDGLMMDFPSNEGYETFDDYYSVASPMVQHRDTLKSVVIKDGVKSIGSYAFYNCTRMSTLKFSNDLEDIRWRSFEGCSYLKAVNFPSTLKSIGSYSFKGCKSLSTLIIPDSVETVGGVAFQNCTGLKYVKLSNKMDILNSYTFSGCHSLTQIELPLTLKSIQAGALQNTTKLKSINIHNNIEFIGSNAFESSGLEGEVILGDNVKTIESLAFYNCQNLKKINIPKYTTQIGEQVFRACFSLEKIDLDYYNESFKQIDEVIYTADGKNLVVLAACSKVQSVDVLPTVTKIYGAAFNYCKNLKEIKMTDNVTEIGEWAFSDCKDLKNIILSNNIKVIDKNLFSACIALSKITLPTSTTVIDDLAFGSCTNLKTIIIPSTADIDFHKNAFLQSALTSVGVIKSSPIEEYMKNCGYDIFYI